MTVDQGRVPPVAVRAAWAAAGLFGVVVAFQVALVVLALGLLARAGRGPLAGAPRRLVTVRAWVATVYCALGVVVNLATPSAAERAIWAPVTAVLLALAVVVMRSTRRTAT